MQMKKPKIILVGGGGHCKSCIDVITSEGIYEIKGIIDLPALLGSKTLGYETIGNDDELPEFISKGYSFLITMGHMGNARRRTQLFELIDSLGGDLPTIKSPTAFVSSSAKLGKGSIIMHNCIVNADAQIGMNSIINNNALIEHDTIIEGHGHISTGAIINGNCKIGKNSFIGSGTVVKNGVAISEDVIIGAGSLVIKPIDRPGTFYGSPINHNK